MDHGYQDVDEPRVQAHLDRGWNLHEKIPDWVKRVDGFQRVSQHRYVPDYVHEEIVRQDRVYRLVSRVSYGVILFSKLKSEYYETTADDGVCPRCQDLVHRTESEQYLRCQECGWTIGFPFFRYFRWRR